MNCNFLKNDSALNLGKLPSLITRRPEWVERFMESRTREICGRIHLEGKNDLSHRAQLAWAVSPEGARETDNYLPSLHLSHLLGPHWLTITGNQRTKNQLKSKSKTEREEGQFFSKWIQFLRSSFYYYTIRRLNTPYFTIDDCYI